MLGPLNGSFCVAPSGSTNKLSSMASKFVSVMVATVVIIPLCLMVAVWARENPLTVLKSEKVLVTEISPHCSWSLRCSIFDKAPLSLLK